MLDYPAYMGYSATTTIAGRRFFRRAETKTEPVNASLPKAELSDFLHVSLIIIFGIIFLFMVFVILPSKAGTAGTRSYLRLVYGAISTIIAPFSHEKAMEIDIKANPISPVAF